MMGMSRMTCEPMLCLPRTCIRGQGFVGCSWGILRFFDIQAISHQEALEVLSFLEARLQPCVCLVPLVPLILLYTVLYLTCLVSSLHLHIRRLFYDLSLYPISLYSTVVAQPFRSKSRSRARQGISSGLSETLIPPLLPAPTHTTPGRRTSAFPHRLTLH